LYFFVFYFFALAILIVSVEWGCCVRVEGC
jgi:hypothetical protein